MPTNTFGQSLSQGSGSPVPSVASSVEGGNLNYQTQVPPTLNASFQAPPQGTQKAPAVVTSQGAEDHVGTMTGAASTALTDSQNLAAHNVGTAFAQNNTDTGGDTNTKDEGSQDKSIDSLLSTLGIDTSGMDDQQKAVATEDAQQIQNDADNQAQIADTLTKMATGSFPLTAAEQTQVNAVRSSYSSALTAAQTYAQSVANGATALVAKTDQQMYSPQIALGTIKSAVMAGQAKVEQVNNRIVSAMSKLSNSLQNQDYRTATALYNQIGKDITTRTKEIDDMNKSVADAQKQLSDSSVKAQDAFTKTQLDVLKSINASGAPADVREAVSNATDLSSMFAAAGQYLQAGSGSGITGAYALYSSQATATGKTPMDILAFSQLYNKAPKTNTATSAALSFSGGSSDQSSSSKLDQTGISDWLSDFYGSGGKVNLPALGIGNVAANVKVGILNGIAQRNHELGISGSQFAAIIAGKQAAQQALNVISRNQGQMTVAEGTANKNVDLVLQLSKNIPPKTALPILNSFIQGVAYNVGDPNVKPFADAILTSLNEYAKVITGQTSGAAVSDAARREAQSLLDAADTPETFQNVITVAKTEMNNRSQSYSEAKNKEYDLIEAVHGDNVTLPEDANSDPVNQALDQSMTNDEAAQKLVNLGADGRYSTQISQLRKDNPNMTPVQIYQIIVGK